MKIGGINWIVLPDGKGRAQAGRRPAIIMSDNSLPTILTVPLTTQQNALRFNGTLLIPPDKLNGLTQPSIALVFQLTTIDKKFIKEEMGTLSGNTMQDIYKLLDELMER